MVKKVSQKVKKAQALKRKVNTLMRGIKRHQEALKDDQSSSTGEE